jgi:chromosome segregation ATPase
VLCDDKFYNMSHAERQHLIYQGPGPTDILQSYVEIVFDNSDNRIPIDRCVLFASTRLRVFSLRARS